MARDPIAIVKAYHGAINALELDRAEAMFAAAAEYRSPGVGSLIGRDVVFAAIRKYFAEYPDQVAVGENYELVAPDKVRADWHLSATAKSTGAPYRRRGVETVTLDRDGLITRVDVEDR